MPRKPKLKPRLEKKEKIKEIRELKSKPGQEEINSLEQMIENNEGNINSSQIREFLSINEPEIEITESSPSLEKINPPQRNPVILERDIIAGNMPIQSQNNNKEEENGFKYLPNNENPNEPKYITQYEGRIGEVTTLKEFEELSKKNPFEKREMGFENVARTTVNGVESIEKFEKYSPVRKSEKDNMIKKDPFERKEVKYAPEKY